MNREIGRTIKQLRTERHMTQDDLALRLHVTRQNISSWENGKSSVSVEYLSALSELFEVSIEELIYGPSPNRPYKKFQRKYIICIVVCAALLLLVGSLRLILFPHIHKMQTATFNPFYGMIYAVVHRIVSAALVGTALCALISLWGDLRLRDPLRRVLLILGILLCLAAILLTALVVVSCCFPDARLWGGSFFSLLYRSWLSSRISQFTLPFVGSILIFLGCNK